MGRQNSSFFQAVYALTDTRSSSVDFDIRRQTAREGGNRLLGRRERPCQADRPSRPATGTGNREIRNELDRGHRRDHVMRPGMFAAGLLVAWQAFSTSTMGQGSNSISVDFSSTAPGGEPVDFTFSRTGQGQVGRWSVVADPTALNGRAIAQLSDDRTDYRFPLAVYQPYSGKALEVSIRFKPVVGKVDEAGGVVVRLLTPDDYYVARANALEDNVRFYRVVKGRREQLATANAKVAGNQWHTLSLKADGDKFTVSFDGKALLSAQDRTFPDAGKVALWTKADSVTYFDTISIRPLK
jgi:hypothetical protein